MVEKTKLKKKKKNENPWEKLLRRMEEKLRERNKRRP